MSESWTPSQQDAGDNGPPTYTHQLSRLSCRICGYGLNNATFMGLDDHPPEPGDVSMCAKCGELSIFDLSALGHVVLREPSLQELAVIGRDRDAALVLGVAQQVRARRPWRD